MEHDDLALDWVGIDCTSILSLIFPLDVTDLQVPLLDVRTHNAEWSNHKLLATGFLRSPANYQ